uniref:Prostate and testis expressed 2 n=1 Tax=Suricata suricatta TaxID=37032 RepID=A0A673UG47_SURSU
MCPRRFQLLLLGIFTVLFMDEGDRVLTSKRIRVCYHCDHFDGYKCLTHLKRCWKFNLMAYNRTCTTDHYYYSDRITGRHLYRYSKLSCSPCEEGMVQEFHDLVRETFCCNHADLCNNGNINMDTTLKFGKEVDKMT